ncbi:TRAP transporter large permease [Mesobacterium pallidum]|uniref:TRAP transporter large permease n=1 Tax=Mesobacterium pallidum TaxID=2872037 RepID=UPI001EE29124|nr:TRAP transporter large permease [Mesobacterium pallidum]
MLDAPVLMLLLGVAVMIGMIILHVPVGVSMALTGIVMFSMQVSLPAALGTVAPEVLAAFVSRDLVTIPLFLLMGSLAARAGISGDIYNLASAWIGHLRGGLAMGTVVGCGGFGALCGSSVATAATMGRVALPEMRARNYSPELAVGAIASGGTLGILIPPSIVMVIYAVLTEQFVLDLFLAGILPGLLAIVLYCLAIVITTWIKPSVAPSVPAQSWGQRVRAMRDAWRAVVVIALVVGGLYVGLFTVVEAASVGVGLTLIFFLLRYPRSDWRRALELVAVETAQSTAMIFLMVVGASLFSYFLTLTQAPQAIVTQVEAANFSPYMVIFLLMLMYLFLGAVFDAIAAMILTTPFVFPLVTGLGFDPIWWGIVLVMVIEIGMITPPIGMNVFVLNGVAPDISLRRIYRGIVPFLLADLVRLALVIAFPVIALALLP